jgi:hypothetical protein
MKKITFLLSVALITLLGCFAQLGYAQNTPSFEQKPLENPAQPEEDPSPLHAEIQLESPMEVQKNIVFDASGTFNPLSTPTKYHWDFGDGTSADGVEVTHIYKKSGKFKVSLTVDNAQEVSKAEEEIFVYQKFVLLITDKSQKKVHIEGLKSFAETQGIYFKIIDAFDSASQFIAEEALTKKLNENLESLQRASQLIVWTEGAAGLNALSRLKNETTKIDFKDKVFLVVSDTIENGQINTRFSLLKPRQIFVAKEAGIYPFIQNAPEAVAEAFKTGGYEFRLIDDASRRLYPWNFMSYLMSILIESGIPSNTILLILVLPVIATVVVIMRQVVGLTTYGMYTPSIVTLTFLVLGLKFGLMTLILSLLVGTLTRYALKYARLLYVPKLSIVLTVVALSLFGFLSLGIALKIFDSQFFSLAIFPMLILGTLTEKFTRVQSEQSFWSTLLVTFQTIFVSILAYIIVGGEVQFWFFSLKWDFLQNLLLNYPEIILLFLLINIGLGKWTGLRIVEYIRFRDVLRHNEEE